ncbi:MAG TPA: FmdB family zinc ribbon protein [Candidatus Tripitaka californicus]
MVYEYKCAQCGLFELRLPIGTAPVDAPCPTCHKPSPRVYSGLAFHFK